MNLQVTSVVCPKRDLCVEYPRRANKERVKLLEFIEGECVLVRNPRTRRFSEKAHIVRRKGYGSWLVNVAGRMKVVNQRFMRKNPKPGPSLRRMSVVCVMWTLLVRRSVTVII